VIFSIQDSSLFGLTVLSNETLGQQIKKGQADFTIRKAM